MIGNASKTAVRGPAISRLSSVARGRRSSLEEAPGAAWETDRELRIVHGFGRMGVVGQRSRIERDLERHRLAAEGEKQTFRSTFEGRAYQVVVEPLLDAKGRVRGTTGVAIELDENPSENESELLRRMSFLDAAESAAHVGSWQWDVALDRVTWSNEMYRIYALTTPAFGHDFASVLSRAHPDDIARMHKNIEHAMHHGGGFAFDHRIVRPTGEVRMLETRGAVVLGADGKAERLFGCCWDVTDTRESASQLERANSLLRSTLEATADGTLVVDREGTVTICNSRYKSLWGIPEDLIRSGSDDELLAFVTDQLIDPESFITRVHELYEQPELESFDILRFKDGRVFERLSRPQRLGDEIVGRVWSFRDVTERELLLRRAMFLADATRVLNSLDVDEALEAVAGLLAPFLGEECAIDMFEGRPRRFVSGKSGWIDPQEPDAALMDGRSRTFGDDEASHLQVPIRRRGTTIGAICCTSRSGRAYSARHVELVEDLATRICLAVENAQLFRGARDALRAREEFIAVAAHEIRGPVTAMHLAVQLLRKGHLEASSIAKAIEVIEREDRRLGRFVEELLDLGRSRTGGLHFVLEDVNLADVVSGVAARLSVELARSGSTLSLKLDEHAVGAWDRLRVEQVVTNLLTNAIKFGERGPIEVEVVAFDGAAKLFVRDHGIGIPKDAQARIFEAFERAVPHRKYGGLGLGLHIVRTIVEGLGGTVRLQSEAGVGTTFEVELPRKRAA